MKLIGFVKAVFYLIGIGGIILLLLAGGGVLAVLIPAPVTYTLEREVSTEEILPLQRVWENVPPHKYQLQIKIAVIPYRLFLGDRNYYLIVPDGMNYANFSLTIPSDVLYEWSWAEWTVPGNESIQIVLDRTSNLTLSLTFTREDRNTEFEAHWEIILIEVDFIKTVAADLRAKFWTRSFVGVLAVSMGVYLPARIEE